MENWGAVRDSLEYEAEHAVSKQHRADIRAALGRVEELERELEENNLTAISHWRRAEAAEAKLARLTNAVESYRRTYLVSMSGTHLGDPAVEIFAAAAKGEGGIDTP